MVVRDVRHRRATVEGKPSPCACAYWSSQRVVQTRSGNLTNGWAWVNAACGSWRSAHAAYDALHIVYMSRDVGHVLRVPFHKWSRRLLAARELAEERPLWKRPFALVRLSPSIASLSKPLIVKVAASTNDVIVVVLFFCLLCSKICRCHFPANSISHNCSHDQTIVLQYA